MSDYRSTKIRQNEILDAALAIIDEQGLEGLTVKAISQRLGQVPSALYRHFPGKEAVLEALLDRLQAYIDEGLSQANRQASVLVGMDVLHHRQLTLLEKKRGIVKLVFGAFAFSPQASRRKRIRALWRGFRDKVARLLDLGRTRGEIRQDLDPTVAALAFLSMFQSAALSRHLEGADFHLSKVMLEAWRIQRQSLVDRALTRGTNLGCQSPGKERK